MHSLCPRRDMGFQHLLIRGVLENTVLTSLQCHRRKLRDALSFGSLYRLLTLNGPPMTRRHYTTRVHPVDSKKTSERLQLVGSATALMTLLTSLCVLPAHVLRFPTSRSLYRTDTLRYLTAVPVFVLKRLSRWEHETALVEYLDQHPTLVRQLGFNSLPDQSTLWRR
jgi:hypothetical protein